MVSSSICSVTWWLSATTSSEPTNTGRIEFASTPLPKLPFSPLPQAYTLPSFATNAAWLVPAETLIAFWILVFLLGKIWSFV